MSFLFIETCFFGAKYETMENLELRPTLKNCWFPIHWPGEIKKVTSHPPVEISFLNLCLKRYTTKRFEKISSWYNENVTLYRFIFNFYVQFLCWFIKIWWWLISIKVLSCVPIQIKQTSISIFLPIFGLTVSFADPLWFAMSMNHDQGS